MLQTAGEHQKKFACTCNTISSVENRSEVSSAALTPIIRPQSVLENPSTWFLPQSNNGESLQACFFVFF